MASNGLSYKDAGVDIEAGNDLVNSIKSVVKATTRDGVLGGLGGFGGLFDLSKTSFKDKNPVLVSGTDGVGTKLRVAMSYNKYDTIGIDLVAMCINDILVQGAEPLFFLDYYACGKLDVNIARKVITGIAMGCKESNCGLVGGETAEMPGMYSKDDFDIAGFAVGAVEKENMLPKLELIQEGDLIIGLPSSGIHSNGYSMVRKIMSITRKRLVDSPPFAPETTFGELLLTPTKLYVKSLLPIIKKNKVGAERIVALCHITGGGLIENIPRILPEELAVELDAACWKANEIFEWMHQVARISDFEMLRTFNCGLGMVVIVKRQHADQVLSEIRQSEPNANIVGIIKKKNGQAVTVKNLDQLLKPLVTLKSSNDNQLSKKRVAVLISGTGSNLQSLIDHSFDPQTSSRAEIALVISNKDGVHGLERAKRAGIQTKVISHVGLKREEYDQMLHDELVKNRIDFICLAGFMRILSEGFVNKWLGKLINIHPALLPSFPGMNTHEKALASGVQFHGATVHFVDTGVDTGAIIRQTVVEICRSDTKESLENKVKKAEHKLYPKCMEMLCRGEVGLDDKGKIKWNQ